MLLKTVLRRVHPVKGLVYERARFNGDPIEVEIRPRKGSRPICSGCGRRGPGDDTLAPRRFEFVPLGVELLGHSHVSVTIEHYDLVTDANKLAAATATKMRAEDGAGFQWVSTGSRFWLSSGHRSKAGATPGSRTLPDGRRGRAIVRNGPPSGWPGRSPSWRRSPGGFPGGRSRGPRRGTRRIRPSCRPSSGPRPSAVIR